MPMKRRREHKTLSIGSQPTTPCRLVLANPVLKQFSNSDRTISVVLLDWSGSGYTWVGQGPIEEADKVYNDVLALQSKSDRAEFIKRITEEGLHPNPYYYPTPGVKEDIEINADEG